MPPSSLNDNIGRYCASGVDHPSSCTVRPSSRTERPVSTSPSSGQLWVRVRGRSSSPTTSTSTRATSPSWRFRHVSFQALLRPAQRCDSPVRHISRPSAKEDLPDPFRPTTSVSPGPDGRSSRRDSPMPRKPCTVMPSRKTWVVPEPTASPPATVSGHVAVSAASSGVPVHAATTMAATPWSSPAPSSRSRTTVVSSLSTFCSSPRAEAQPCPTPSVSGDGGYWMRGRTGPLAPLSTVGSNGVYPTASPN